MMWNFKKSGAGFTLIEFIMYTTIVGVILLAVGAIGINIFFNKAKLTAVDEVSQNSRFVLEKITYAIRNAEIINSPSLGTSGTSLSLQMADLSKNPTLFDLNNGFVRIKEGAGNYINLTTDEVVITNLQFSNLSYTGTPGTMRIEITVKFNNLTARQEYNFEKTFYATANIREK